MAVFSRQFKDAETIYLDNNQVDSVIRMYQNMNKWEEGTENGRHVYFLDSWRKYGMIASEA